MSYLALDLGAGSGRAIAGQLENGKLLMEEIFRFENQMVRLNRTLYWDFPFLFSQIKKSIYLATKKGYALKGIAVDTWGVDFGLLDKRGNLLSNPVAYRDTRTEGIFQEVFKQITKEELYRSTGIQLMEINTLFQLFSLTKEKDPSLNLADKLLFMPDLINYFLTGKMGNEYTIASTSQFLNAETRQWEKSILNKLNIPEQILGEIIQPGVEIGRLREDIMEETGAFDAKIYSIGSHDTASAIAAIPAKGDHWGFLSSGTWSLLGVCTEIPILTEEARDNDFTNEGGANGQILFMRNITGLWLLQKIIAEWEREGVDCSFKHLLNEACLAEPFRHIVYSDDPTFSNPTSMRQAIRDFCTNTHQKIPETVGEYVRCVMESLALNYYFTMEKLKKCTGKSIDKLFIVGGGSKNQMLNQFIANALNMEVITGLTEATAIGNIIQQAIAAGDIANGEEGHSIIQNSFDFHTYYPENKEIFAQAIHNTRHLFE